MGAQTPPSCRLRRVCYRVVQYKSMPKKGSRMDTDEKSASSEIKQRELSARLAQHLRTRPQDLVDARRLMRDYQVSAQAFQNALTQIEQTADD